MDRAELEQAFAQYQAIVEDIRISGDWARFADLFTEDADYIEHSYGTFKGRDQIRTWIVKTMTSFPATEMIGFPANWAVFDEAAGRVVCEVDNPMRDPGNGAHFTAANITILDYAGDGLWRRQEDVYNPQKFADTARDWAIAARDCGTLSEDGARLLAYLERA